MDNKFFNDCRKVFPQDEISYKDSILFLKLKEIGCPKVVWEVASLKKKAKGYAVQ
jgi:hypothetical protein